MKTTNYYDTFIAVADDCPVTVAEVPPKKGNALTVANLQFDMISQHPYQYTSDDVIFTTYAIRNQLNKSEWNAAREAFFSKGQACLRASPLCKRYGWGIHSNSQGKVALYGIDSPEYSEFLNNNAIKQVKAMRSKK